MTSFRFQLRRAALLFAALFVFAVITQLAVGWYQRRATARGNLLKEGHEILQELRYSNRWDLTRFRQADLSVNRYYILDRSGLVLDFSGFVPDLLFRADLTDLGFGERTVTVPVTNETWRLLVIRVNGGQVILGYSSPERITGVDERLKENAKYFGNSLQTAMDANISDTDRDLEYAVLDDDGRVRFALGGIPLKLLEYPKSPFDHIEEIRVNQGVTYGLLSVPFTSAPGQNVGVVTVIDELPPQPWLSLRAWLMNFSASFVLAFAGMLFGVRHIRDQFRPDELLCDALEHGESSTVEFKESLRWDCWKSSGEKLDDQRKPPETKGVSEAVAVKTVAGFLNSRSGGVLVIGVADDKKVIGLDRDYDSLVKPGEDQVSLDKKRDRFQLHWGHVLAAKVGHDVSNLCVETAILPWGGRDVCIVRVNPAPSPVYATDPKGKVFYLRVGAKTVALDVEEAVAYCRERWPGRILGRILRLQS